MGPWQMHEPKRRFAGKAGVNQSRAPKMCLILLRTFVNYSCITLGPVPLELATKNVLLYCDQSDGEEEDAAHPEVEGDLPSMLYNFFLCNRCYAKIS